MRNTTYISKIDFKKKNHNRWTQKTTMKDKILRVVTYDPKELKSGKRQNE
jgi:hypothetical protein